jgi:hypothetical protein
MATAARDTTPGAASDQAAGSGEAGAAAAATAGLSRAVVWTGVALGTAVAVLAMTSGALLRVGGLPAWAGVILGAVIVWALIVAAAVTLAELTRRHHKTAARFAFRQGKRGGLAAGRAARRSVRAAVTRAAAWAGPRWQSRQAARPRNGPAAGTPPAATRRPDGKPETEADKRFFDLRESGYAGPIDQDGHAVPQPTGGTTMATSDPARGPASRITPGRRARRIAARAGGAIPPEWGPVVAQAADFEPESDGHLLDWMTGQVTGMAAYAEALIDAYETGVNAVGIDPKGLAALHDVADAAAHAAETMSGAKAKFADHYELPREFAANGGLMTHDGRWITGEGG